jgi:hypothetical protein
MGDNDTGQQTTNEQQAAQQPATEQAAEKPAKPKREKKPPRQKKMTREVFLVNKVKDGITDVEELGKLMEVEITAGNLGRRVTPEKLAVNLSYWTNQVRWYLTMAKKKGLIAADFVVRKKKEKPAKEAKAEAAPAVETPQADVPPPAAATVEEDIGTL